MTRPAETVQCPLEGLDETPNHIDSQDLPGRPCRVPPAPAVLPQVSAGGDAGVTGRTARSVEIHTWLMAPCGIGSRRGRFDNPGGGI